MKYFFLSDGWTTGRVWEFGGLWNEIAWQRKPIIKPLRLYIEEATEKLWLYQVEDDVLMVEVLPEDITDIAIGQVVLKRLMTADQVIEKLCANQIEMTTNSDNGMPKQISYPL
ncbi:MAG: hypothetical protein KTR27_18525 [Leptolyngbyaceae cyanobacterium MAG.088]|nr:hypothetical protein [Leptolyngbyaceae cyanobacterium MAG.088]